MVFKKLHLLFVVYLTLICMMGCSLANDTNSKEMDVKSHIEQVSTSPKYVFMFIGDGMSQLQINAAQMYQGKILHDKIVPEPLNFSKFPVLGLMTTYNATSFIPDSASAGTALSSGIKTGSGVIGLEVDKKTKSQSIAEKLKLAGKKIGIVTSVPINHATPAAYYAHVPSRNDYYEIANQLATSGFDYFAGGSVLKPTGSHQDEQNVYEIIREQGYRIVETKEEILSLDATSGKVYAKSPVLQDNGSLPYALDTKEGDLTLSDFVQKGIEVLDNDEGFFMMVESGKIDWACHGNDAMTVVSEVIAFQNSIEKAMTFANDHPDETLIIVTGDHETGGMSIGYAQTGYETSFELLQAQKMSYIAFNTLIEEQLPMKPELKLEDIYPLIKENFGLIAPSDSVEVSESSSQLVMTDEEWEQLQVAFNDLLALNRDKKETSWQYGNQNPLSVTITHLLNHKAGIGWTTYVHTGAPVAVYAMGVGANHFDGFYDNTDLFDKLVIICGVE